MYYSTWSDAGAWFNRFARRERIADGRLSLAVKQIEMGIVDADLGGGLIKQRVARPGKGKSGGYRILLIFQAGDKAVIFFGFAKNDVDNIDDDQMKTMREIAGAWPQATPEGIAKALDLKDIVEVPYDQDK